MSQGKAAAVLGLGRSSVQKMERETEVFTKVLPMHRLAARLYGWTEDSIDQVLGGGVPTLVDGVPVVPDSADSEAALQELTAGMSARAIEALRRGSTVDTDVVNLAPGEVDVEAVLIFKSSEWEHVSPERKRVVLAKWDALQRAARAIFSESDEGST